MPIARDFFSTFLQMKLAENPWVLWGKTIEYLKKTRGLDSADAIAGANLDIEVIMSELGDRLADPTLNSAERVITFGIFTELTYLFACVVNSVSNGPISAAHQGLANWLNPDDVVITFNWDVLMDKALLETGQWHTDSGYGFRPKSIFRNEWVRPIDAASKISLLKLHGSANWFTAASMLDGKEPVLTHTLSPDACFVFERSTTPYACYAGRYMEGYGPLTCGYYPPNLEVEGRAAPKGMTFAQVRPKFPWIPEGTAPDHGLPSAPLLIAPERKKNYGFYGDLFSSLWSQAEQSLHVCEEIVCIGYSFPTTDVRTREMFGRAFMGRTTIPRVTIIDPHPQRAKQAFQVDLGIPSAYLNIKACPFEGQKSL